MPQRHSEGQAIQRTQVPSEALRCHPRHSGAIREGTSAVIARCVSSRMATNLACFSEPWSRSPQISPPLAGLFHRAQAMVRNIFTYRYTLH